MVESMEHTNLAGLASGLLRLASEGGALPNMPREVFAVIGQVVPLVAVEIGITTTGQDLLLAWRRDPTWTGWHVPGGYIGVGESPLSACDRIARRELAVGILDAKLIDTFTWTDHPCGAVISLLCLCTPSELPATGCLFNAPPRDVVPHHSDIMKAFLRKSAS